MELNGRSYIMAANLLLVAATYMSLQDKDDGPSGTMEFVGGAKAECQANSIRTANTLMGCRSDLSTSAGAGQMVSRGTSKTVIVSE